MKFYGFHILPPEENMKIDEELINSIEEGKIEPTFRIYKWSEVCISIGRHQEKRDFPIKVVRRPTGGGALLHGWDISFAIVDYKKNWGGTPLKIYRNISNRLKNLFMEFEIDLKIEKNKEYSLDKYFCFFFPTFGELKTACDKKLVSIAMMEKGRTFLAHGSIYIDFDFNFASRILKIKKEALEKRIISLKDLNIREEDFKRLLYFYLSS